MARTKPPKQSFAKDSRTAGVSRGVFLTSFHPDLPLFASATLSLDSWHIRITDPTTTTSRNDYALGKNQICRCLGWGSASHSRKNEKSKKKRKVEETSRDGILGAGTNDGSIYLFSPAEDVPIAVLSGGHTGDVLAMSFTDTNIWTCGSDGRAVEWNIESRKILQTITIDTSNSLKCISVSLPNLLVASYTIHHLILPGTDIENTFTNHTSPIHSLIFGPDSLFVSAADEDRYMNIFSTKSSLKTLVAEADVKKITYGHDVLCAITAEGVAELFLEPFSSTQSANSKRRKSQVSNPGAKIRVLRPDESHVELVDASVRPDGNLILAWTEGSRLVFERIRIRNEDDSLIDSTDLVRSKLPSLGSGKEGREKPTKVYQDGNAQVTTGTDMADMDMVDKVTNGDADDESSDNDEDNMEAQEEPTLADRLHSLEVSAATPARAPISNKAVLKMPPAGSLTAVLTQALKSNDVALLESCLHHSDSKIILATVRRIDATLAVTLLEQLASRISRRPGRSADLGVWVRWTIVVHGGYLASLPGLIRTLSSLHSVLATRAATLPRLLALQGRLDMVHSQIELRREGGVKATGDDPSDVEYIEGQSDLSDEEEIGIEDASQLGGLDTSEESAEEEDDSDNAGDFSEDSGDGNEFAELDAQMEMMQDDDDIDDEEEVEGASDEEA